MDIRFERLKLLLNDMEEKGWLIDSFSFNYNAIDTIVILKLYKSEEKKPNKYAKAKLEFIRRDNIDNSIKAYIDFFEVHFESRDQFVDFFNIENRNIGRDVFLDFSKYFSHYIPKEKNAIKKDVVEKRILGSRAEANNPNAIYCYDVRRNGEKNDKLNKRSIENSNKAATLRPELYELYKEETNYSFFFSENPEEELSDSEIAWKVAQRAKMNN